MAFLYALNAFFLTSIGVFLFVYIGRVWYLTVLPILRNKANMNREGAEVVAVLSYVVGVMAAAITFLITSFG